MLRTGSNGPGAVKKKLIIKPLKEPPKLPADFEEKHWALVTNAARIVLWHTSEQYSNEAVCRAVEDLVGLKVDVKLYSFTKDLIEKCIREKLEEVRAQSANNSSVAWRLIAKWWTDFLHSTTHLMHLFVHLDRRYVLTSTSDASLRALSARLFCEIVGSDDHFMSQVLSGYLATIEEDRNGDFVDRTALAACRDVALQMNRYNDWEVEILKGTKAYYEAEGRQLTAVERKATASEFFRHCQRRIQEEKDRARAYFHSQTRPLADVAVHEELLVKHAPVLLNDGRITELFKEPALAEDLRLAYCLLKRRHVQLQNLLRTKFRAFVSSSGESIINAKDADDSVIAGLIELNATAQRTVARSMGNNEDFKLAVREGFEPVLRIKPNKISELLARYVDGFLKDSNKQTEQETEETLDEAMKLYNVMPTKDIYNEFHIKDFAKRLIYQRSAGLDLERHVISRLREISGSSLAVKLEGMIKDTELSKELSLAFTKSLEADRERESQLEKIRDEHEDGDEAPTDNPRDGSGSGTRGVASSCEVSINVLTQAFWPASDSSGNLVVTSKDIILPEAIKEFQAKFLRFYSEKHNGRRLTWQHSWSQCTVTSWFAKQRKELAVSFFQAILLLCFNKGVTFTYKEIQAATAMEEEDLVCALMSLSAGQFKILKRDSGATKGTMAPDETFTFNESFTHKLIRLRIPQVRRKAADVEAEETVSKVFQERSYVVDAVLIRIMKTRKTLSHNELIAAVTKQVKFPCQPVDIKKRIEVQIEREYLKRSDADKSVYEYLA